jgi:CRISPR-associated protein Csa3
MLYLVTLGFSETFALRGILSRGLREEDRVIIVMPSKEDPRAEKAKSSLLDVLTKAMPNLKYNELRLPHEDFYGSVKIVRDSVRSFAERPVYVNLSGGMRLVILETLLGLITANIDGEIEVYSEDYSTQVSFRIWDMTPVYLDREDRRVLEMVSDGITSPTEIAEKTGISKATAWRKLKRLEELGLVADGRITGKGRLYLD